MDIFYEMGVSKLSAKVFLKVNYSFKSRHICLRSKMTQDVKSYTLV